MKSPPRHYYVYVIEAVDPRGRRILYVGQSGKTPAQRLKQHKAVCTRYCATCECKHYIHGRVIGLRRDLYEQYNPLPNRPEAERVERLLAGKLRRRGYTVKGGH